jgi:hypothetical protein
MAKVTYRLAQFKRVTNEMGGYKKSYPTTYTLPSIVRLTTQDDKGDFVTQKLRYAKGAKSIYYEENKMENGTAIKFEYGYLDVDTNKDPLLYQFLETIDLNGSKTNRNKSKPVLFFREDLAAEAENQMKSRQSTAKRMEKFWVLSEAEREAVAVLMGVKTQGKPASVWSLDLLDKVVADVNMFEQVMANNDLTRVSFINKAQKFGLLELVNRTWYFNSAEVVEVPVGIDPYTHLTGWINKNEATFDSWKKTILEKEQRITSIPAIREAASSMTGHEVLELGMREKVLMYDRGRGWKFAEENLVMKGEQIFGKELLGAEANNKTNAANFIDNNPAVKEEIITLANAARAGKN